MPINKLEKRILDISYKHKLSHLGSCLTSLSIIDHIFLVKKPSEPFILDNSHAFLALAVVLEKNGQGNAEDLFEKCGVHADRIAARTYVDGGYIEPIDHSGGSLGIGSAVAVGMALADRSKNVYLLLSDGGCAEGIVWEALRIAGEQRLENLRCTINGNSYGAYGKIDVDLLDTRMQMFYPCLVIKTNMFKYPDFLQGQNGHYATMTKEQYEEIIKI